MSNNWMSELISKTINNMEKNNIVMSESEKPLQETLVKIRSLINGDGNNKEIIELVNKFNSLVDKYNDNENNEENYYRRLDLEKDDIEFQIAVNRRCYDFMDNHFVDNQIINTDYNKNFRCYDFMDNHFVDNQIINTDYNKNFNWHLNQKWNWGFRDLDD